mgnify:CR=1 FL=1
MTKMIVIIIINYISQFASMHLLTYLPSELCSIRYRGRSTTPRDSAPSVDTLGCIGLELHLLYT